MNWMDHAACKGKPSDVFYVEVGKNATEAAAICADCPVRHDCLMYAIDNNERHGVWGGLAEKDRRKLGRELGRGPMRRIVAECGTHGGVARHKSRNEDLCGACREFVAKWNRERRRRQRGSQVQDRRPMSGGERRSLDAWMHRVLDDIFGPVASIHRKDAA